MFLVIGLMQLLLVNDAFVAVQTDAIGCDSLSKHLEFHCTILRNTNHTFKLSSAAIISSCVIRSLCDGSLAIIILCKNGANKVVGQV